MLVAYGPDGRALVAEEEPLAQLQHWSHDRVLRCPNCRGIVHVRGGPDKRTQLHFAHQKGECAWSTEGESVRHARGKWLLAQWLRAQFPTATVTLEERLPEPNRIADVFVRHADGQQWAIEFQCAPLDIEEWRLRHDAYRNAGIIDTWIIGCNRREKQEAFIEAVLATAHEILFLDPLVTPPRIWLRWPLTRLQAQKWQLEHGQGTQSPHASAPTLDGWVGRMGFGMTLIGSLDEVQLDEEARLVHPLRTTMQSRAQLLETMSAAQHPTEQLLRAYLHQSVAEDALRVVLLPLLRAYLRDPELLRRYNYGRGQEGQPVSAADHERVQKARVWLQSIARQGFTPARIRNLLKEVPYIGPYAAFVGYAEMLLSIP